MERQTTSRPTDIYNLIIKEDATNLIKVRTYRLNQEDYIRFEKMLDVSKNGFTLINIVRQYE